jgi:tripartite-type tricarboxylate transporter receptor subunit TctC
MRIPAALRPIGTLAMLAGLFGLAAPVFADTWPIRTVKIVTPLAPGAATDLLARAVGDQLSAQIGQPVIVENRPGGAGTIAGDLVARAAPDGYTLLLGAAGIHASATFLIKKLNYDPVRDFTPLTTAAELPIALVVHPSLPVKDVAEFIAYARQNPGKLSFGSSGYGTTHHLAGELLKSQAGIDMVHVPYRGGAPAMVDLLAGQIPVVFATLSTVVPHLNSGKLKVLGMVEERRSRLHPDIPRVGETVPGYATPSSWMGFFAPAGLPAELAQRLNAELVKSIAAPSVRTTLEQNGFEIVTRSTVEFAAEVARSTERLKKIATDAGVTAQ